ncbi:MAG TPA: aldo/keto reductase [Gaiellaceae bacterium]|jgi:aryl-alcohol dehydrogenase-like predicted oxidoreductase|nr:aldo/keto reductase [Gaiellaceae bacterium]
MRYLSIDLPKPVSKIGLGTWQFGSREWGYGDRYAQVEAARIVERALELGITLFDTAEIYGLGRSERILGRALQGHGDVPFVATKIFPLLPLAPVVEQRGVASAQRLGLRHLDLYQVHQPNPVVRDRTTMRGMRALQDVGLVGAIGVSNYSLERWRRCEAALGGPVLSNQVRYNLVDRRAERDVIPYAEHQGRVVIAYSPLAQGFLSGRYDASTRPADFVRRRSKLFRPDTLERGAAMFGALREVADAHGATPSQVALAWAIRRPNVVAIPGASSVEQVESNAAAADLDLHHDEIRALADAATAVTSMI